MGKKRNKRKTLKELKEIKEQADISENVVNSLKIPEVKKPIEAIKEEKSKFDIKVEALAEAIRTPEGRKLALRIKIYNNICHIYQGLLKNVWGRINPNGSHTIYRHALTNLLRRNENTKDLF
tara:strand:+ start:5150 stop:5515 length:366 start_codon:yes stop_codon:yes gene_type:complete